MNDKEKNIILAAIYLKDINDELHYVPDYELIENSFSLQVDEMREIRDLIQSISKSK